MFAGTNPTFISDVDMAGRQILYWCTVSSHKDNEIVILKQATRICFLYKLNCWACCLFKEQRACFVL